MSASEQPEISNSDYPETKEHLFIALPGFSLRTKAKINLLLPDAQNKVSYFNNFENSRFRHVVSVDGPIYDGFRNWKDSNPSDIVFSSFSSLESREITNSYSFDYFEYVIHQNLRRFGSDFSDLMIRSLVKIIKKEIFPLFPSAGSWEIIVVKESTNSETPMRRYFTFAAFKIDRKLDTFLDRTMLRQRVNLQHRYGSCFYDI